MKSIHDFLSTVAILFIVTCLCGCNRSVEKNLDKEAEELFRNSVSLIKCYSDSMRIAEDTARVNYLTSVFDNRMTALNFKYPADTDLALSEEENDSLIRMIIGISVLRKQRLEELGRINQSSEQDLHLAVDTVEVKTE